MLIPSRLGESQPTSPEVERFELVRAIGLAPICTRFQSETISVLVTHGWLRRRELHPRHKRYERPVLLLNYTAKEMVPMTGLEPARLAPVASKTTVYAIPPHRHRNLVGIPRVALGRSLDRQGLKLLCLLFHQKPKWRCQLDSNQHSNALQACA